MNSEQGRRDSALSKTTSLNKSRRVLGFAMTTTLGIGAVAASSYALTYVVQPGETLSHIAQKKVPHKPYTVFSKGGALEKLVGLNPQVKNPDLLTPGEIITLPGAEQELAFVSPAPSELAREPASEIEVSPKAEPSPKTEPSPPSIPAEVTDDSAGRYGIISLTPGFSFFRINATDPSTGGTAQILSNVNTELSLSWKQVFSPATQTHLDFNYSRLSLSDPKPRTISTPSNSVFGFDLGITHSLSPQFRIFSSFGYKQELLLRALSSSTLTLDRLFVPFLSIGASYEILKAKPFTFSVDGQAAYLAPTQGSEYKFNGGPSFLGRLKMSQDVKLIHGTLEGAFYYKLQKQDTSVANQTRTDVGATVGASWSFE